MPKRGRAWYTIFNVSNMHLLRVLLPHIMAEQMRRMIEWSDKMNTIRIGFAKRDISPAPGVELGGYAGFRPCAGVHDPLYCKAVVLEQEGVRYALVVMDLMCVDEALAERIAREVDHLGISRERLLACAIHTHAAPQGSIPGEGPLDRVNNSCIEDTAGFTEYMLSVVSAAGDACRRAVENLEPFRVCTARGPVPEVGSERHTGGAPGGDLTVVQCCTESGKNLILYNFPCHPTVLSAANLEASGDFAGGIEKKLDCDMAVFVNGAAGDISTRFTRREATFTECDRMAGLAAEKIMNLLKDAEYVEPQPLKGIHKTVTLRARKVETEETARKHLAETTARWQQALSEGADAGTVRILKSYVEGAGVSLEFARNLEGIQLLQLPVTVFRFAGLYFASVPGELFSTLQPKGLSVIGYANGYYRYICGEEAYEAGYYEALAAILARGEGERLVKEMLTEIDQLKLMESI